MRPCWLEVIEQERNYKLIELAPSFLPPCPVWIKQGLPLGLCFPPARFWNYQRWPVLIFRYSRTRNRRILPIDSQILQMPGLVSVINVENTGTLCSTIELWLGIGIKLYILGPFHCMCVCVRARVGGGGRFIVFFKFFPREYNSNQWSFKFVEWLNPGVAKRTLFFLLLWWREPN